MDFEKISIETMSAYKSFEKDFVTRTKANLEWCLSQPEIPYSTTNIVNNCLGLIVLPKEFATNEFAKMSSNLEDYGLSEANIRKIKDDDKSIFSILHHLRNGIAHGHIQQDVQDGDIVGVCIMDSNDNGKSYHTEITLTIKQLLHFALTIAEAYIK